MKTLEYPMVAITIDEHEWSNIMSPLLAAVLPTASINRKFPQVLVYVPLKFQGLGVIHPYYRQELIHIMELLHKSSMLSITGEQMRASMEQPCLEVGGGGLAAFLVLLIVQSSRNVGYNHSGSFVTNMS
jgi:hypothetical protein